MAEKNEYFTQKLENGTLQISEDVVASVAAAAVLEVEGVCGLSSSISTDIAEMLGMKTLARGVRLTPIKDGSVTIECDVVAKFGQSVFSLARPCRTPSRRAWSRSPVLPSHRSTSTSAASPCRRN